MGWEKSGSPAPLVFTDRAVMKGRVIRCRRRPWVKWGGGVHLRLSARRSGRGVRPSPLRYAPGRGRPRRPSAVKTSRAAAH